MKAGLSNPIISPLLPRHYLLLAPTILDISPLLVSRTLDCRTVEPFGANLQLLNTASESLRAVLQALAQRCTTPPTSAHKSTVASLVDHHYSALCITSSPFPTSRQSRHAPLHNISNCGQHGSRSPLSSHSFTCKPHPGGSRGEALLPPSVRSRVKRSPALPALPSFSACELCR